MEDEITPRLRDRFDEIDRRLEHVENDVRTRADGPIVAREIEDLRMALRVLRSDYAQEISRTRDAAIAAVTTANQIANDVIRSGRSENLKLIGIVIGVFGTIGGAIIAAVVTGKI